MNLLKARDHILNQGGDVGFPVGLAAQHLKPGNRTFDRPSVTWKNAKVTIQHSHKFCPHLTGASAPEWAVDPKEGWRGANDAIMDGLNNCGASGEETSYWCVQ